jgi:hypothetical protein
MSEGESRLPSASSIERVLRARSLPDQRVPAGEFVLPSYDGWGIANVPATLAALLGASLPVPCPPLQRELWSGWSDGLQRVVLIVIDALGYLQLRSAMAADEGLVFHELAEAGRLVPMTSLFPSTTNAVLTTLWSGYSPAAHGVLAYELYLRELGVAASTLFFWPIHHRQRDALASWGIDAETFVPVPSLAEQLSQHGITTRLFLSRAYMDSMLSRIHTRDVHRVYGFTGVSDMWLGLQRVIERHQQERLLLVAYWDTIDAITHNYGPDDEAWSVELHWLSTMMRAAFLERLAPSQREGTLLLVVADHGGLATPVRAAVRLGDHAPLRDALSLPPLGENRATFLHARGDALDELRAYMEGELGSAFVTLSREEVLASGLLGPGPVYEETPHRLGDLVCLARDNHYLARDDYQLQIVGRHGGLSAQEMLVPLLGVRLDAL